MGSFYRLVWGSWFNQRSIYSTVCKQIDMHTNPQQNLHFGHHNNTHKQPEFVLNVGLGSGLGPFGPAVPLVWWSKRHMAVICLSESSNSKRQFPR
jgi:hypothetical protein